jgi:tRNA dimethylallyltransferase
LVGPTAAGKSALALAVARARPRCEIVSIDSMQVYRGMDIGTAKPTHAERREVPHHLVDLVEPSERFTVARFAAAARAAIADIVERGRQPLLVGGTGLYLQAVLGDIDPPGEWPEIKAALEAEVAGHPAGERAALAALHSRLATLDPTAAERMEPTNRRRIVRALEVCLGSGGPFSAEGPGVGAYPAAAATVVGVWLPRAEVATRIERRVAAMIAAGWVEEVRALRTRPGGIGATARQALGYRELLRHLEAGAPLPEMVDATVRRTRAFSVRQRRWFRRDPRIRWYGTTRNPVALLPAVLRELDQCRC